MAGPGSAQRVPGFCFEEHGMNARHRSAGYAVRASIVATALIICAAPAGAQSLAGLWDATVVVSAGQDKGTIEVPFRFEITGTGANIKGSFFNGDDKMSS